MRTTEVQCYVADCGHSPFPMSEPFYDRARKTHEFWHCPAGHSQHFVGKSEEEKLQARVESLRKEIRKMERWEKVAYRTCPWIGCFFVAGSGNRWDRRALWSHMRQIHGMPTMAEVLAEEALLSAEIKEEGGLDA